MFHSQLQFHSIGAPDGLIRHFSLTVPASGALPQVHAWTCGEVGLIRSPSAIFGCDVAAAKKMGWRPCLLLALLILLVVAGAQPSVASIEGGGGGGGEEETFSEELLLQPLADGAAAGGFFCLPVALPPPCPPPSLLPSPSLQAVCLLACFPPAILLRPVLALRMTSPESLFFWA